MTVKMFDDFHFVFGTMNINLALQMEKGEKKAEVQINE